MTAADSTREMEFFPIPNYPGYRVSRLGEIQTCWSKGPGAHQTALWRRLSQSIVGGYPVVGLRTIDGGRKHCKVYRIVCEAFHGPCPSGMQCCHADGNRLNSAAENLRWGTTKDNQADKTRHNTNIRGSSHPLSKLTETDIPEIRRLRASGLSLMAIGSMFGVSDNVIMRIVQRKKWKHVP